MRLVDPTDDQLNATFATEVAGWRFTDNDPDYHPYWTSPKGDRAAAHFARWDYTTSADAVLPWLERYRLAVAHNPARGWTISISGDDWDTEYVSEMEGDGATSFARNAVIALLRTNGVEIEFTK